MGARGAIRPNRPTGLTCPTDEEYEQEHEYEYEHEQE